MALILKRKRRESVTIKSPRSGLSCEIVVDKIVVGEDGTPKVELAFIDPSRSYEIYRTEVGPRSVPFSDN